MNITDVKSYRMSVSNLTAATFQVWGDLFVPFIKIVLLITVFNTAAVVCLLLLLGIIPVWIICILAFIWAIVAMLAYQCIYLLLIPVADDIICSISPSISNALSTLSIKKILKLIAVMLLLILSFYGFRIPLFLTDNPLITAPYMLLVFIVMVTASVYILFFPQAILLRNSGVLESLKFSYYLVKDRWWHVCSNLVVFCLTQTLIMFIMGMVLVGIFILIKGTAIFSVIGALVEQNILTLLMLGPGLIKSFVFFILCLNIIMVYISCFWIVGNTLLFSNLELDEEQPQSMLQIPDYESKKENMEFSEIFKNVKEINISTVSDTERISRPALNSREDALRNFEPLDLNHIIEEEQPQPKAVSRRSSKLQSVDDYPTMPMVKKPLSVKEVDGKMPTLDFTIRENSANYGLPSMYKKTEGQDGAK